MMRRTTACLFPAFGMKYRDFHRDVPAGLRDEVSTFLQRTCELVPVDLDKFEQPGARILDDPLEDALQEHYISYVDGCALGSFLRRHHVVCDYVAGYSMGLFAALYHSGAVSYEDGLDLLRHTCRFAHEAVDHQQYGMGAVVGFTPDELRALIAEHCPGVEVADVCGPRVVIVSGVRSDLERLLEAAEAAGSLQARFLPVTIPFHSARLHDVERRIRRCLERIDVRTPRCGIVSCVSQELLTTPAQVADEVAGNVWHPLRWYRTMRRLRSLEVSVFLECGLSESLCNLLRNVEGDFHSYHPRKFPVFLSSGRAA